MNEYESAIVIPEDYPILEDYFFKNVPSGKMSNKDNFEDRFMDWVENLTTEETQKIINQ